MADYLFSRMIVLLTLIVIVAPGAADARDVTPTSPVSSLPAALDCEFDQNAAPRPIQLGISGGSTKSFKKTRRSIECCEGTLGSLVKDGNSVYYILSNNHVLARQSTRAGHAAKGESIVQPGLIASSCQVDQNAVVASLKAWVPLKVSPTAKNLDDAAIAQVRSGEVDLSGAIWNIGPIAPDIVASNQVTLNLPVQKQGRTSCLTFGTVDGIDATIVVRYTKDCRSIGAGRARFIHQIVVGGFFSSPGDSGSLVVTQDACPRAIGLLFAGGRDADNLPLAFANPIDSVLDAFRVSMVGTCNLPSAGSILAQTEAMTAAPSMAAPSAEFARALETAKAVKQRHDEELTSVPDVIGTAVTVDKNSGKPVIQVYVRKTTPQVRSRIPAQIDGVPVILRKTSDIEAY